MARVAESFYGVFSTYIFHVLYRYVHFFDAHIACHAIFFFNVRSLYRRYFQGKVTAALGKISTISLVINHVSPLYLARRKNRIFSRFKLFKDVMILLGPVIAFSASRLTWLRRVIRSISVRDDFLSTIQDRMTVDFLSC